MNIALSKARSSRAKLLQSKLLESRLAKVQPDPEAVGGKNINDRDFTDKDFGDRDVGDNARFLKSWLQRPLTTGAVSPSGKALARMIARYVDPNGTGPVVEIGPGTGPVTEALLERGIAEERLVLIEFSPEFSTLLRARFPRATIVEGDAYSIATTLGGRLAEPAAAIVSSLPLLTKSEDQRLALLADCFALSRPNAPFIQFTYGNNSPIPLVPGSFSATVSPRVWLNIPPARVWVYRKA